MTQPGECDFSLLTDWAKQKVAVKGAVGAREIRPSGWSVAYSELSEVCYERISVEPFREPAGSEASAKRLPRRR